MITESLETWKRGAQAIALLTAAQERGYLAYLASPRRPQEFAAWSGLPAGVAADVLAALAALGVVDDRFQLTDDTAAALAGVTEFGAKIEEAALAARQVAAVARTGEAPLSADDALILARAWGLRPAADGQAGGLVARLFEALPEMWQVMSNGRLLDVGSGISGFVISAATVLPGLRATTLELVPGVAAVAAARAEALGVRDRIDVRVIDAPDFDEPSAYDAAFWAQPFFPAPTRAATLAMIRRSLRPGGFVLVQQLDAVPDAPDAGFALRGLVARAQGLPFARPAAELAAELDEAGFVDARVVHTDLGPVALARR